MSVRYLNMSEHPEYIVKYFICLNHVGGAGAAPRPPAHGARRGVECMMKAVIEIMII